MTTHTVRRAGSLVAALLVPATAWAHPGHGAGGGNWSVLHYVTEPEHVASGVALLLVLALARTVLRRGTRGNDASARARDAR